jgi:hypothetical protein
VNLEEKGGQAGAPPEEEQALLDHAANPLGFALHTCQFDGADNHSIVYKDYIKLVAP